MSERYGALPTIQTKRRWQEKNPAAEAFLRGYLEGLAYVKSQKYVTMKIIAKYTRQRDSEVLGKWHRGELLSYWSEWANPIYSNEASSVCT
jgi:ABC-type nitrate/sulfonate/bicarbonate transport system substrate-binding protein